MRVVAVVAYLYFLCPLLGGSQGRRYRRYRGTSGPSDTQQQQQQPTLVQRLREPEAWRLAVLAAPWWRGVVSRQASSPNYQQGSSSSLQSGPEQNHTEGATGGAKTSQRMHKYDRRGKINATYYYRITFCLSFTPPPGPAPTHPPQQKEVQPVRLYRRKSMTR